MSLDCCQLKCWFYDTVKFKDFNVIWPWKVIWGETLPMLSRQLNFLRDDPYLVLIRRCLILSLWRFKRRLCWAANWNWRASLRWTWFWIRGRFNSLWSCVVAVDISSKMAFALLLVIVAFSFDRFLWSCGTSYWTSMLSRVVIPLDKQQEWFEVDYLPRVKALFRDKSVHINFKHPIWMT